LKSGLPKVATRYAANDVPDCSAITGLVRLERRKRKKVLRVGIAENADNNLQLPENTINRWTIFGKL
jgi:hypothetical protein